MTIRQVLKMGDPLLLKVAEPVHDFESHALRNLVEDMQDTMSSLNGAGLAASQIDRKSTRLNSSHIPLFRMPSSA